MRDGHATQHIEGRSQFFVVKQAVGDDQLARIDAPDVGQQPRQCRLRQSKDAGGDIDPGERKLRLRTAANARKRHEVVGFCRREQLFFGQRAGRDKTHDVTFDHRFRATLLGFRRVFHLFADGNAVAAHDQLL